jgi:hypothetical protein
MLAGGLDLMYRSALATSHAPYLRIDVLDGNRNLLEADLTFLDGGVSATLTSRVSRTCTVTFDESLYPFAPDGLLAPYGNIIQATRGIEFADGSRFAWTVFIGRIQEASLNDDGTCSVFCADFSADVVEVKFLTPQNSQTGNAVAAEVIRLIADAVPLANFGTFDAFDIPVQALTWQLDRAQALDELGTSVGAFWYPLADGSFVLRRYPWIVPAPPVVTYSDGDGGSVVGSSASRSREEVFNSLTVTGERLSGDEAVYATAQDDNPASPTDINGPFGRRHQLLRLQTPASQGSAQAAALDNLKRLTALVDSWEWTMTADAALELGDTVSLDVRGQTGIIQVVSSFSIPLAVSSPMTVRGRSLILGILEGE